MATRLSSVELYDLAEQHYGGPITPEQMLKAEPYARRKLGLINSREGTDHGDDYLAILIAETVHANAFSAYTFALCGLRMAEREEATGQENGAKKEPHPKARPFNPIAHFTTPTIKNQ